MSDKIPNEESPDDKQRPLPRVIVVDCSDWEPDIPLEKCSRGQFITDPEIIAKRLEELEALKNKADPNVPPPGPAS